MLSLIAVTAALAVVNALPQPTEPRTTLPVVDLGYELHQAAGVNSTGPTPYYNFTNIRYGQSPVGPLRFAPPRAPDGSNRTVTNGLDAIRTCPQARPAWEAEILPFLGAYLSGGNISAFTKPPSGGGATNQSIPTPGPGETEDCLFLDVFVPTKILDTPSLHGKAPVLVWIYGGGYTAGSKSNSGNPATLIAQSAKVNADEGVIFVELNYRLGLFGWISGDRDVTANAGLLDQRLALEWVHKYISLFGGDPNKVTVMGESAGGGSIMHHIASPSNYRQHFQRAIPQSPAYEVFFPSQTEALFATILEVASLLTSENIASADDLRALPFSVLYALNVVIVGKSAYGTFTFGPVVDTSHHSYVPDIPLRRIANGHFHEHIKVLVGHNSDEGLLFTAPFVQTEAQYEADVNLLYPTISNTSLAYLTQVLYPPVFNGSQPYFDQIGRTALTISDALVGCNAHVLASTPSGFGYFFSVPPGVHGEDVDYTFFNGDTSTSDFGLPVQAGIAKVLQTGIAAFAGNGASGLEKLGWGPYGTNSSVTNVGFPPALGAQIKDPADRPQCAFWTSGSYDPIQA